MSSMIRASMPSFGVSRRNTGMGLGMSRSIETRPVQEYQGHITNTVESALKIPIVHLPGHVGRSGDIVLNEGDNLLYYHTGGKWSPLAVMDQKSGDYTTKNGHVHIIAANGSTPLQQGGNVIIGSGIGGMQDGHVAIQIAGEDAVIFKEDSAQFSTNVHVKNMVVMDELKLNKNARVAVFVGEYETESTRVDENIPPFIPDTTINNSYANIKLSLNLEENQTISGKINSALLHENTFIQCTVCSDKGIPLLKFGMPTEGSVEYTILAVKESIGVVRLCMQLINGN